MKKILSALGFSLLLLSFASNAKASPGDTTWVQAQNDVHLDYFNDFDAQVSFPNGSTTYRKIIMVFTLGKYQCPAGTQYCGDWDYTVQNYLMTPTDTFELSRLITPYANASYPRTPFGWKQRYYFDVTDFYPYLKNNAAIRLSYHNYSGGFTGNIRFAFIEGTPARTVTGISKLWEGSFSYGETNPIDNQITAKTIVAPAGTQSAEMRFTVTGHGADNNGCSEFCSRYYQVKQNSSMLQQKDIWKADCGFNNLYPQSGTWVYDRANWCPGEQVLPASYRFNNILAGTSYTADVDFQTYTKSGTGSPSYILSGYMIHYGAMAQTLDASVEDIISPSDYEGYFRSNPMFGSPVIRVKNTGSTVLTTLSLQYGVEGQTPQTYSASGLTLAPMADVLITLPTLTALTSLAPGTTNRFFVTIQQANGVADPYTINNTMRSNFVNAPIWPAGITMIMKTNNSGAETKWRIEDLSGNIIAQRVPTTAQTTFNDPVNITTNGVYRLIVNDAGCNGLYWWANANATGTGWIYTLETSSGNAVNYTNGLPAYPSSLSQDFGCGFTQYFRVTANFPTATPTVNADFEAIVNPNPFTDKLVYSISLKKAQVLQVRLFDMQGRMVASRDVPAEAGINHVVLEQLGGLPKGMYLTEITGPNIQFRKKLVK